MTFIINDQHGSPQIRVIAQVWRSRSFESAGRRIALLGRLLDETSVPGVLDQDASDSGLDSEQIAGLVKTP